jgi:hypothetical protein
MKPSFRVEVTQQWSHHAERYLVDLLVERENGREVCGAFDLSRAEWLALSGIFCGRGVEIVHRGIQYKNVPVPAEPAIEADIRSANRLKTYGKP